MYFFKQVHVPSLCLPPSSDCVIVRHDNFIVTTECGNSDNSRNFKFENKNTFSLGNATFSDFQSWFFFNTPMFRSVYRSHCHDRRQKLRLVLKQITCAILKRKKFNFQCITYINKENNFQFTIFLTICTSSCEIFNNDLNYYFLVHTLLLFTMFNRFTIHISQYVYEANECQK